MTHNLASKSPSDRRQVELDKQAALAIYRLGIKEITRFDIDKQIASLSIDEAEYFRFRLNHHKNAGLAKHKREVI